MTITSWSIAVTWREMTAVACVEVEVRHRSPRHSPRRHPVVARKIHAGRYRLSAAKSRKARSWSAVHAFGRERAAAADGGVAASATLRDTRFHRRASFSAAWMIVWM